MLSRLISLLSRIPAVKWAFTRLRPAPHGANVDVASIETDGTAAIVDVVETAPACVTEIGAEPLLENAGLALAAPIAEAAPVTENDIAVPVVAESPSTDIGIDDASVAEMPADVETPLPVVEQAAASSHDLKHETPVASDLVTASDTSSDVPAEVEPVVAEEIPLSSAEIEAAPVDGPDDISKHDASPVVSAAVGPVVADQIHVVLADADGVAADAPEASVDGDTSPGTEITPAPADDRPLAAAIEVPSTDLPGAFTTIAPAPAVVTPAADIRSARKARARPVEPADRAALIRQRWEETGIRMWNPRLHGTGDATLNIQGSVGLLPPAPGETMPRYDKLEFKMLGGQIVCEGVIVEAPAHASQRSFTRLAESAKLDRVREPVRERQAALA